MAGKQGGRRGNGVLGSSQEPAEPGSHRHRRTTGPRSTTFKLGLTASVLAGLALAVGATGLTLSTMNGPGKHASGVHDHSARPPAPLRVVSVTPAPAKVSGTTPVQIVFSAVMAKDSATPVLKPPVAGGWELSGSTITFVPDVPLPPSTTFTLRVPAGNAGVHSAAGVMLARPVVRHFRTAPYSQVRLVQLLSTLGYLPLSWQPAAVDRLTSNPTGGEVASQQEMAYSPPAGSFTWQHGYPAGLRAQWRPGQPNTLVQGAVMAFKAQHHMAITAATTRRFWTTLFAAVQAGQRNAVGYTYALASERSPETLTIWHDGHVVLTSLANTGIPVAPTALGTFPVYLRYQFQIMRGTNPDGSHYADPVSYVAYFNGGDAVHYFPRAAYGYQQSLGCVELPYNAARQAWPFLTYGSLVTVTG